MTLKELNKIISEAEQVKTKTLQAVSAGDTSTENEYTEAIQNLLTLLIRASVARGKIIGAIESQHGEYTDDQERALELLKKCIEKLVAAIIDNKIGGIVAEVLTGAID